MNYTTKYHLPQWDEDDRIMRTDFNQMCANMEAGLTQTAQTVAAAKQENASAAAAAQSTANTALSKANAAQTAADAAQTAADNAQTAADNAQATANSAQTTADAAYCPSYKPYVTGSYTGTGSNNEITVELGFRPKFLVISAQTLAKNSNAVTDCVFLIDGFTCNAAALTSTGFKVLVAPYGGQYTEYYPKMLELNKTYYYIAFR